MSTGYEGELDVVEPVALGDRPRELPGVDRLLLEQDALRGRPSAAALGDRGLDLLGTDVAEGRARR